MSQKFGEKFDGEIESLETDIKALVTNLEQAVNDIKNKFEVEYQNKFSEISNLIKSTTTSDGLAKLNKLAGSLENSYRTYVKNIEKNKNALAEFDTLANQWMTEEEKYKKFFEENFSTKKVGDLADPKFFENLNNDTNPHKNDKTPIKEKQSNLNTPLNITQKASNEKESKKPNLKKTKRISLSSLSNKGRTFLNNTVSLFNKPKGPR